MAFEFMGINISFCESVYEPAEDTFLLLDALEKEKWKGKETALEIGPGTGIVSIFLAKRVKEVFAADISRHAALCTKKNILQNGIKNAHVFCGDLFGALGEKKFDIIVFNTPYLPEDKKTCKFKDSAWSGGKSGRETIDLFLPHLESRANKGARIFIVESSRSNYEKTISFLRMHGFHAGVLANKRVFFEEIVVIRATIGFSPGDKQYRKV